MIIRYYGLKNYFINVGKTCGGLKIKDEIIKDEVNLDKILKRYNFIKEYQESVNRNRKKILGKQNNIKEQAQKQGQARGQGWKNDKNFFNYTIDLC